MNQEDELTRTAEVSVIGAILIDEKALPNISEKLVINDFYHEDLKEIYGVILDLSGNGKPVDFLTVLNEFPNERKIEMKKLLLFCADSTPSVSNASYYAEIVHKLAMSRKIKEYLVDTLSDVTSENILEKSENLIENISSAIMPIQAKKMKSLEKSVQTLFDFYTGKTLSVENRVETGFKKIDSILQGMSGGNLIVLAARPKVGKTAFALSVAENVAKSGKKVVFFSQEMLSCELCERILSKNSGVSMTKLINKNLSQDEIKLLEKTLEILKNRELIINDSSGVSVNDIRMSCKMLKNLGLIVVDYLQLMHSGSGKCENRNQEIGKISRDLKRLATDLNVPILCLSQLNRTSGENQKPSPSEIRDSGEVEQNCNKLMLMWCVSKNEGSKTIGLDVALNRRGGTGTVLLNFCGERMKFTELETKYKENKESSGQYSDWRQKYYSKS
ncbi:MAG: DnaB-like helicase C-terminal domain-containing protein [Clostridia bacterium]|nr:DnaB-like helicase C-terminal domain-containing protein [Clostridia bacterium]